MKKEKFESLVAHECENIEDVYKESLDFAFENNDIRNIAISGVYGSGKTTLWKTYISKNEKILKDDVLYVSLGDYRKSNKVENENLNNENLNNENLNRVEKQIINQILSQIQPKNVPLSKYKYKEDKSECRIVWYSILGVMFIISVVSWFIKDFIINLIGAWYHCIAFSLFIIPIYIMLYLYNSGESFKLSKVNFKFGEVTNVSESQNDESILDKDMKEVVYILEKSNKKYVVFEDLDRYNDENIFIKLRELNNLVNNRKGIEGKDEHIKFIYMIKDDLFDGKTRVKFFDFIIPVIPVVDSSNSEGELLKLLEDSSLSPRVSLLKKISIYIDDMRLLKNIVNEYKIYSKILLDDKLKLDKNKLFSMIVFKNIFSEEFTNLQQDRGYIFNIINSISKYKEVLSQDIKEKIKENEEEFNKVSREISEDKIDKMVLMLPSNISVGYNNKSWGEILKDWENNEGESKIVDGYRIKYGEFIDKYILNSDENKRKLKSWEKNREEQLVDLDNVRNELENRLTLVRTLSLKETLLKLNSIDRDGIFLTTEDINKVRKNHYFPLIRFLILEGLIDESYKNYKGRFREGSLKVNDNVFLRNVLASNKQDPFLEIESPDLIYNELDDSYYLRESILNKTYLEYLISKNNRDEVLTITSTCLDEGLIEVLNSLPESVIKIYVEILIDEEDLLLSVLRKIQEYEHYKIILKEILVNKKITEDKLKLFKPYLDDSYVIDQIEDEEKDNFYNNIKTGIIKFKNVQYQDIEKDILKNIVQYKAYNLNLENIIFLVESLSERSINYGILIDEIYSNEKLSHVQEYVEENFEKVIKVYIQNNESELRNRENIILRVLNSEIGYEFKKKYLERNVIVISNCEEIINLEKGIELIEILLSNNTLEFTSENLIGYLEKIDFYDENLIGYLEKNISNKNLETVLNKNIDMCNTLLNSEDVSEELFQIIITIANQEIVELSAKLPEKRIKMIAEKGLIAININNVSELIKRKYYGIIVILLNNKTEEVLNILENLSYYLPAELLYLVSEENLEDNVIIKLIELVDEDILLEKLVYREDVVLYLLSNELSKDNIVYIFDNFNNFSYKKEFIEGLHKNNIISELIDNDELPESIKYFILKNSISYEVKEKIILKEIDKKTDKELLEKYISLVFELKELAGIWKSKYPELDTEEKEKIAEKLIKCGYAKRRKGGRLMST